MAVAPLLLVAVLGFGLWLLCAMRPAYPNQLTQSETCYATYGSGANPRAGLGFTWQCWSGDEFEP